ncbi:MAG: hypothetical protein AAF604_11535 [Acidobacteriota bacterium]
MELLACFEIQAEEAKLAIFIDGLIGNLCGLLGISIADRARKALIGLGEPPLQGGRFENFDRLAEQLFCGGRILIAQLQMAELVKDEGEIAFVSELIGQASCLFES